MSSRLRQAFVAAKPEVSLELSPRARQSVATAARSSGVLCAIEQTDEQELVPTGVLFASVLSCLASWRLCVRLPNEQVSALATRRERMESRKPLYGLDSKLAPRTRYYLGESAAAREAQKELVS